MDAPAAPQKELRKKINGGYPRLSAAGKASLSVGLSRSFRSRKGPETPDASLRRRLFGGARGHDEAVLDDHRGLLELALARLRLVEGHVVPARPHVGSGRVLATALPRVAFGTVAFIGRYVISVLEVLRPALAGVAGRARRREAFEVLRRNLLLREQDPKLLRTPVKSR